MSVVIAAHDQGRWLGEAIEDVRAQTFPDWELVVVDDGSTDDTPAVVRRFAGDPRIRGLRVARAERSAARNRGIAASSAPYVAFLDGDDRWRPEKLARQVAALDAAPDAALCYTPARFVDPAGRPLPLRTPKRTLAGRVFPALVRVNWIILASVLVRRACLDVAGVFPLLPVYGCEDWDLWLRLARRWPFAVVDEELTLYRQHAANTAARQLLESALLVVDRTFADPAVARETGLTRADARALQCWVHAAWSPDRRTALRLAARALRESPRTLGTRPALAAAVALARPRTHARGRGAARAG